MSEYEAGPVMSVGYHARVVGIWEKVVDFLSDKCEERQIVIFGAGFDTLFWRLCDAGKRPAVFVEVDLPAVCRSKAKVIAANPSDMIAAVVSSSSPSSSPSFSADTSVTDGRIIEKHYRLLPGDLRNRQFLVEIERHLHSDFPILFISECVLIYLPPADYSAVTSWAAKVARSIASRAVEENRISSHFICYEQRRMKTAFTQIMARHFEEKGCPLLSLVDDPSFFYTEGDDAHWEKSTTVVEDMWSVYLRLVAGAAGTARRPAVILDEIEELKLLLTHYVLVHARI